VSTANTLWRSIRSGLTLTALAFLAALTSLAQPGLCPCWLIADAVHPHPGGRAQADHPHPHGYLFEMFQAQPAAIAPALVTARALVNDLAAQALWQTLIERRTGAAGWGGPPDHPPPRAG